uniref:Tetraspanin-13 n=1 Tax=Oryzias latipes TaxID=8090 RepID=A0A3P9JPA8_ORYLA
MVRPGLQHQRGGGGHRGGSLPPLRGLRGSVRRPEAPPGAPLLRILQQRPSSEAFAGCWGAGGFMTLRFLSLFQYMVILFMVFVLQFSISCACLALNTEQQNQLLEVGWNKSESTQMDVEKTLNCCGFSSVNLNQTCPAVSGCSPSAAVLLGPSLSKARLLRCSVASPIPPAPPAPASCRRTPGTCSTSLAASACSSASRRSVGRRANVCARFLQLSEILLVSFRSSESGSLTDTGT